MYKYTIIINEKEKYFRETNKDDFNLCMELSKDESIIGQFYGEDNKNKAIEMILKLRKDLKWRHY